MRWPGALAVTTLIFALIYYVTPDVKHRSFKWITPGAVVGVLLWLLASVGFSLYLSNFANLNALYGAFTGAIVLVFWLWLTNVALLFGAELNAAIERKDRIFLSRKIRCHGIGEQRARDRTRTLRRRLFPDRGRSQTKSSKPAGAAESPVQVDADRAAITQQHGGIAELPPQLRHVVEVHAVDPGHGGGHGEDRHPGGDARACPRSGAR